MRRLSLNRSEPAKKSGQSIPKNRCRTTIAERMVETLAELPFIGDQVGLFRAQPGRPERRMKLWGAGADGGNASGTALCWGSGRLLKPRQGRPQPAYHL